MVGEDRAEEFLVENGFSVIRRNFRTRRGEIDVIAIKNGILHFIEVKTFARLGQEALEYAVGKRKRSTIIGVSKSFLFENRGFHGNTIQYDVLFLRGDDSPPELMENVFTESGVA